jgi:GT2 family glycosyltransferase
MPVDVARNHLAQQMLDAGRRWTPSDAFCLWFDDDAMWSAGTIRRAVEYFRAFPKIDILAGYFCIRAAYVAPAATKEALHIRCEIEPDEQGLIEVEDVGFHWLMHRLNVLEAVGPDPFSCFQGKTEDNSFCQRARNAGFRIFVATDLRIPHVDVQKGTAYLPYTRELISFGHEVSAPMSDAPTKRSYGPTIDEQVP